MSKRIILILIALLVFAGILAGLLHGSDYNKRTVVRFNEPVMVAGVETVTLPPGEYVVRLMNHDHNRNIVQFFNAREDHLYATVLAIPSYRLDPQPQSEFGFWETPRGNPVALRSWFPNGDNNGQEFVYPKGLAARIAEQTGEPVLITSAQTEAELDTAPVEELTPAGEVRPFELAVAAPGPRPIPAFEPAPEPAPQVAAQVPREPVELTPTASPYFTIGLLGALAAAAGLTLRRIALRKS